jgi:hypothetical protein
MINKLFTHEIWQTLGALIARHPSLTMLLLFLLLLGGIIQQWLDRREIRGLKAETKGLRVDKDATESRLKLAQDEQKAVTSPVEILRPNSTKLEAEVAALMSEVAQIKGALPQSIFNQLDKVAATTAIVTSTARDLSKANAVLGSTLSRPSASPALRSDPPSATIGSEDKYPSPFSPPKSARSDKMSETRDTRPKMDMPLPSRIDAQQGGRVTVSPLRN